MGEVELCSSSAGVRGYGFASEAHFLGVDPSQQAQRDAYQREPLTPVRTQLCPSQAIVSSPSLIAVKCQARMLRSRSETKLDAEEHAGATVYTTF